MPQTQTLTTAQLQTYADSLQHGTLTDVQQVYADLYNKGYDMPVGRVVLPPRALFQVFRQ